MSDNPGDTSRATSGARAGERAASNGDGPRARIAGDRLVRWIPRKLGALAAEVSTPSDLCIASDVIEELRRQTASTSERRIAGLLVGRRGRHAGSERPFALVERCLPCDGPAGTRRDQAAFHEDLLALREEVEGGDGADEVLGWYHSHSLLGVFLSEQDTHFHEEHFPESWQCALILVSDRERPAGGVFQQTEGLGLRRSIYVPFYEVVAEGSVLPDGRRRCRLDWENYVTDSPVVRAADGDAEEAGAAPAFATADGADADGESGRPANPAVPPAPGGAARRPPGPPGAGGGRQRRAGDLPADIPVVIPMEEGDGFLGRHRRTAVTAALVLALALGGWWALGQLTDGGSAAAPAPPADRVARDVDGGTPLATDAGPDAAAASGETAAAPGGPGDVPAAPETGAADAGAAPAPAPATAASADAGDAAGGADAGGAEGGAVSAFEQAFGAFEASVGAYGERRQAFAAGNMDCATLADAYRRVDEAFITLSARYARPGVPGAVGGRYEDAATRMEGVDRHFDASGCPRPQ